MLFNIPLLLAFQSIHLFSGLGIVINFTFIGALESLRYLFILMSMVLLVLKFQRLLLGSVMRYDTIDATILIDLVLAVHIVKDSLHA